MIMKKRNIIRFSTLILLVLLLLVFFLSIDTKDDDFDLLFADNYISCIIPGDSISFNIFGAREVHGRGNFIPELISDIEFNNENIRIKAFSVEEAQVTKDHHIFNFIIEAEIEGDNIEKANEIIIFFNDKETKKYSIGEITLVNNKNYHENDIETIHSFTIGYPIPSLDVGITNKSNDTIHVNKVYDLNKNLNYNFNESTELKQQENYDIIISTFEEEKAFDFYTITPILQYSKNGQDYFYNMHDVIYGVLIPDEEKIQKIIN